MSEATHTPITIYDVKSIPIGPFKNLSIKPKMPHVCSLSLDPAFGEFKVFLNNEPVGESKNGIFHFTQPADSEYHSTYDMLKELNYPSIGMDIMNASISITMIPNKDIIYETGHEVNLLITGANVLAILDGTAIMRFCNC